MTQDINDLIVKANEVLSGIQKTFGETADETSAVQRALEEIFGAEIFTPRINTWADVIKAGKHKVIEVSLDFNGEEHNAAISLSVAEIKSAQAYLILRQLIDVGYGGNPTFKERLNGVYLPDYNDGWYILEDFECINQITFRTEEDANRFISFPENCELLDDYYMRNGKD